MSRKVKIKISDGKEFEVEEEGVSFKKVIKSVSPLFEDEINEKKRDIFLLKNT